MNRKIDEIISLIFATRRILHEQLTVQTGENFSFLQFTTLRFIKEKKPLMKEVADFLAITPPSATSLIRTLAQSDMIRRNADKNDRRIIRLEITVKGEVQMKKWREKMAKHMKNNLKKLNAKEQNELIKILTKITHN